MLYSTVHVLGMRSNYQRGTVGIQNEPSIASTPLHICGYSKSGPGFVFFCVQWLRDSFINIGIGITFIRYADMESHIIQVFLDLVNQRA
jgi:hypothetical protein